MTAEGVRREGFGGANDVHYHLSVEGPRDGGVLALLYPTKLPPFLL